ncbi:unnamed protein product [Camellia sinensis]
MNGYCKDFKNVKIIKMSLRCPQTIKDRPPQDIELSEGDKSIERERERKANSKERESKEKAKTNLPNRPAVRRSKRRRSTVTDRASGGGDWQR